MERKNVLEQPKSIFVVDESIIEDTHHFMNPQSVDTTSHFKLNAHDVQLCGTVKKAKLPSVGMIPVYKQSDRR